jgi:hypothetical protein
LRSTGACRAFANPEEWPFGTISHVRATTGLLRSDLQERAKTYGPERRIIEQFRSLKI